MRTFRAIAAAALAAAAVLAPLSGTAHADPPGDTTPYTDVNVRVPYNGATTATLKNCRVTVEHYHWRLFVSTLHTIRVTTVPGYECAPSLMYLEGRTSQGQYLSAQGSYDPATRSIGGSIVNGSFVRAGAWVAPRDAFRITVG